MNNRIISTERSSSFREIRCCGSDGKDLKSSTFPCAPRHQDDAGCTNKGCSQFS